MKVNKFNYEITKKAGGKSNAEGKNSAANHPSENFKKSFVIPVKPAEPKEKKIVISKEIHASKEDKKIRRNNSSVSHAFYKTSSDLKKKSFVSKIPEPKPIPDIANPMTSKSTKKLAMQPINNGNHNQKQSKLSNNYICSPISKSNLFKKENLGALKSTQPNLQNSPGDCATHKQINCLLTSSANSARQKLNRQTSASIVGINKARLLLDRSEDFNSNGCNNQVNNYIDIIVESNSKDFVEDEDLKKRVVKKPVNSYLNFYKGKTVNTLVVETDKDKVKKLNRGLTSTCNLNNQKQAYGKQRTANPSESTEKILLTKEGNGNNSSSKLGGMLNSNKMLNHRPMTTVNRDSSKEELFTRTSKKSNLYNSKKLQ